VLVSNKPLGEVARTVGENLSLIPSDINLAAAEVELAGIVGREVILREAMALDATEFDYVLMDCGPSLGVLTLNAWPPPTRCSSPCSRTSSRCTGSASCSKPPRWWPGGSTRS
jgi:hypothetical protein